MVLTKDIDLPECSTLTTPECKMTTAALMTAAPYLGKACENINNEFMLCRVEFNDPRRCIELGKKVTSCTIKFFEQVKKECSQEFNQYAICIDQSSGNYQPWHCRKTQLVFDTCMYQKLCMIRPDYGYFTRGRIHKSTAPKPKPKPCPCESSVPDPTPSLPDCKERKPARFTSRFYWFQE